MKFFQIRLLNQEDIDCKDFLLKRGYNLSVLFRNMMYELKERENSFIKKSV